MARKSSQLAGLGESKMDKSSKYHHHWRPLPLFSTLILFGLLSQVKSNEIESCVLQTRSSSSGSSSSSNGLGYSGSSVQNNGVGGESGGNSGTGASDGGFGNDITNNVDHHSVVLCQIRTLHPDLDLENLTSSISSDPSTITRLRLVCSDVLFFESTVKSGQLQSFTGLKELIIEKCKLKHLPDGFLRSLPHLRKLKINSFNSDWAGRTLEVSSGALALQLRALDIGYNGIFNLPELCKLGQSIHSLNLTHNLLSDIDDLGLPGRPALGASSRDVQVSTGSENTAGGSLCLGELRNLDLSHNQLRNLGGGRMESFKKMQHLKINNDWLEELDDEAFRGMDQLRHLNLSSNRLVALPPKVFHPCKGIRELDLHNNSLTALSPMLLNGLEHLQVLDLSMNSLASQYIASEIFNSCVRLVILNLRSNQFTHISNTTFTNLYSLQILDISENLISSIDENTFAPMSNLHSLHLGRNRLVSIDSNMLNGLFVLSKLSLDYNQISVIRPDAMKNCTSLADLSLIGNRIGESNGEVPHALRSLANLRSIDLGENSISQFHSESFYGNSNLIGLRLVENRISELGSDLCQYNKNLRVLNLAKNRIPSGKISSRAFHSCGNLRVLRLDENLLDEINFADTLPSLLWLNVSQNALKVLDYGLLPKKLEWLDIRYNELESLVGSHGGIRAMDASYNRLTNLSHHSIPTSIEILRVNNNRLSRISPDTFLGLSSLRRVEMISNQLENIPLNALRISPNGNPTKPLPEFFLGGNALLCNCHMEYLAPSRLKQLNLLRTLPTISDLDTIMCRLTFSRNNQIVPLLEMTSQNIPFLCKYESHCFATCQCCEYEFCDCSMTCPSNCTCYRDSEWQFNVVNCANSGHTSIPPLPMDTTEVYIDSNNIKVLKSHSFIGRKNTKKLFLNSSGIEQISNKSFNGLQSLEILHLEFNRIKILHGYEFDQLSRLRELYLQSNLISAISNQTFLGLKSLEVLRIDGNRLAVFQVWQLSLNPYLVEAYISNPFSCECDYLHQIYLWVTDNSRKVVDLRHLQCFWNTTHKPGPHLIDYNQTCSSWAIMQMKNGFDFTSPLPLALAFVSFITLFILVVALVILCRENFSLWLFTKFNGLRMCSAGADFEDDKSYDSYLIYSQKDEEFVAQRVADMLETNDNYRLCLHYRDLICETGDLKDMMIGALENSKSVLIILSRNFLQGEWSSGEYRSAFHAVLKKSQRGGGGLNMGGGGGKTPPKKILIVFIEDIPKVEISPDIRSWVRHNKIQVIKWNIHSPDYNKNRKFWNKLKFSLPDPSSHYHSNITSNTTTTSASSGESNGGIMATLKYSTAMQAESQLHHVPHSHIGQHPNHHHHPHHHHQTHPHHHQQIIVDESGRFTTITTSATNTLNSVKYWPYGATNFVALPPKYQQGSHHGSVGGSHPPSMHSPGSPHSLHYHPPLPISNPPKSPPSSQSTDSTTTTMADEAPSLLSQLTMASFNRSNNSPSASSATKSPVPVPKSSYSSRNTLVNNPISNSNSTSNNIVNGGESYLDGEHVYSTLDPPSPQPTQQSMSLSQNILGNGSSGGAPNFLNNIHLPNGYTYQPQSSLNQHQQNHHHFAPLSSPSGAAAPGNKHGHGGHHHQVMSSFVGNGAANNGGVGTGGKQQGFKQKVSDGNNPVQTYLV